MHRYFPLFTLAFLSAAGIQITYDPMGKFTWFSLCFIAAWAVIYLIVQRLKREQLFFYLLLGSCIGFAYANLYMGFVHEPIANLHGQRAAVQAVVTAYADRYEDTQRVSCKVQTEASGLSLHMPSFSTVVYLPLTEEELMPGDQLQGTFSFYRGTTSGGFDRATYYAGRNHHILASLEDESALIITKPAHIPLSLRPAVWAQGLKHNIDSGLDSQSSSLIKGLLFGDTADLSIANRQSMQKAGLSHITAVSGMHIGFLVAFFTFLFGRRVGLLFALGALVVFVPMAGASPSVIRAAIMYAFAAVGFYVRLEHSALHSLCAALLLLLLHNPYAIHSLSLQLSFLASLGLVLFASRLQHALIRPLDQRLNTRWKKRAAFAVAGAIASSLGALVLTVPVLLRSFGYVSAASVVANLLTISVFSAIFILGLLFCIAGGIPVLSAILAFGIKLLCVYVLFIAKVVGGWVFTLLYWDAWHTKVCVIGIYLVLAAAFIIKRRFCFHHAAMLIGTLLLAAMGLNSAMLKYSHRTAILASGNGQAIAVSYGLDAFALIDCGASGYLDAAQSVQAYMDWNGFSQIDMLVLTAIDKTHARNVPALMRSIPIKQMLIPPQTRDSELSAEIMAAAEDMHIPLVVWLAEDERRAGDTRLGLSLIGGIPRKLSVRIAPNEAPDMLVMHSLTPKMAAELLTTQPLSCNTLVLSGQFAGEDSTIEKTLSILSPREIILQAAWSMPETLEGIALRTTKDEGDIILTHTRRGGGIWQQERQMARQN